jgi:hypothetical protein
MEETCFAVELARRHEQGLMVPKRTAALTVLMEQAQDAAVADEAASLMYTLERVVAEDDFRRAHEKAMRHR